MLHNRTNRWTALLLSTALMGCLSAPPKDAPVDSPECTRAHLYSQQAHTDISDSYRRTNLILTGVGVVLWFGFVEALAIPVVGIPISYYQHESQAKENVRTLIKDCSLN